MEPTSLESYTNLCVDSQAFPEIRDAKIGDEMTLTIKVVVKDLHAMRRDTADNKDQVHGCLCVESIKKV